MPWESGLGGYLRGVGRDEIAANGSEHRNLDLSEVLIGVQHAGILGASI